MNIPNTVRTYLARKGGQYRTRTVRPGTGFTETATLARLPFDKLARSLVVKSGKAYLMAITRADHELDLDKLNKLFKREFALCNAAEIAELFPNCASDYLPPMAEAYGLRAILDRTLMEQDEVYFCTGAEGVFIHASMDDFRRLQEDAWYKQSIIRDDEPRQAEVVAHDAKSVYKQRVESVNDLPAMPGLATEIMRIRNNPYSHAAELAAVIEQDPSLSAQLVRYALSPLYGYQGKVESVEQAIVRVLGMDFVLDIAFGLSLGKTFKNPKEGPIGLRAFWHHAIHCAALTQALCNAIDYNRRPPPGMGYLAGLLHNFGFLLLGHLFPDQFKRLNKAIADEPERSVHDIEREQTGVTHNELGLWLMDAWEMPREIIDAVEHHHDPEHKSDYSIYSSLVYIANCLLKRHGIGDAETMDIPADLLARVGLDQVKVEVALASVLEDSEGMEFMAAKMAA